MTRRKSPGARGIIGFKRFRLLLLALSLVLILPGTAFSQAAGNIHTEPAIILTSTKNVTLRWDTTELSTSFINCSAPGFSLGPTPVESEPVSSHSFSMNVSFSADGPFACTISTYPLNGTPFETDFVSRVNCEGVRLALDSSSTAAVVYFNRPKGSGAYSLNASVRVRNVCTGRADVRARTTPPPGIGMSAQDFVVRGLDSFDAQVIILVPDSMNEGRYSGQVVFSSSGSSVTSGVNITVHWPGPKLGISVKEIGNVKSGTNLSWAADVSETFGYRALERVGCSVSYSDLTQEPKEQTIGRIEPFGKAKCRFSMSFPARDVKIGNYSAYIRVFSGNGGEGSVVANYTMPLPYMLIAPKELFLGKLTFDSGNDVSSSVLQVIENGGFTPLERISFRLLEGEEDWIVLPDCRYASPGGSANCTFTVSLSENASIGVKWWTIAVSSSNTADILFRARADVYFIGIDDAISQLEGTSRYSLVKRFGQAETLKASAIEMLKGVREGNETVSEISSVISTYGGVMSILSELEDAQSKRSSRDTAGAGRSVLSARMSLERIWSGYESAKGRPSLLKSIGTVYSAGLELWSAASDEILRSLEAEALSSETSNFRASAERYSILSRIYNQSSQEKSELFGKKAFQMEEAYAVAVGKAGEAKRRAASDLALARSGTVLISGYRVIIDPLSYGRSSELYRAALSGFEEASMYYGAAGQQNELNRLLPEGKAAEAEFEFAERCFTAGSVAVSVAVLVLIMRVVVGMQRYREDEDDRETGGVMVR